MRLSKIQKKLINICEIFKLGEIEAFQQEDSSQNSVYKIVTTKGIYIVKEYSKDAIGNYYYLRKRKEQIAISEQLKKHKINCIIPKRVNDKQFFLLDKQYYLVYDCSKDKYLTQDNITKEHIIELAKTQAKIHKLNIETKLPCTYKNIIIDFELFTKIIRDPNLKDLIDSNKSKLNEFIKKGNNALPSVKKNLCYSHNDYKHQNILWNDKKMTLIDFDASGLSNPTAALIESAFTYSRQNNEINYDDFELYIKAYLEEYGPLKDNFKDCLYVSMNGKLQWLNYLMFKKRLKDVTSMLNTLILFASNVETLNEIYENLI